MAKKRDLNSGENRDSHTPGATSEALVAVEDKLGLPKWKDLSKELSVLAEKNGKGWADELKEKVDLYRRYVEYHTFLALNFQSLGGPAITSMHNAMDLQLKLMELEEKIKEEGRNPLEDDAYVRSRQQLAKELEFIHKHKLDVAQFQHNLEKRKKRVGDDDLFTVEAEVKE